jgi:hypothetical protein
MASRRHQCYSRRSCSRSLLRWTLPVAVRTVEIMVPSVAQIAATEGGFLRGLWNGWCRKTICKESDRPTPRRGDSCVYATTLERVGLELIERKPHRQVRGQPIFDRLEGDAVIRSWRIGPERVEGLGVERAVADIAIAAHVAHECSAFRPFISPADDGVVVHVSEAAALDSISRAVDLIAAPKPKVGAFLQQLLDGERGRILEPLAADRRNGLARRLRQGARARLRCGCSFRCGQRAAWMAPVGMRPRSLAEGRRLRVGLALAPHVSAVVPTRPLREPEPRRALVRRAGWARREPEPRKVECVIGDDFESSRAVGGSSWRSSRSAENENAYRGTTPLDD